MLAIPTMSVIEQGKMNSIIVDMRDDARKYARTLDKALAQGKAMGPLAGVPMTVKESYNIIGTPTTRGTPEWRDNIAEEDADAVKHLKSIGVNIFGKTNTLLVSASPIPTLTPPFRGRPF